jgi:hypothetical protein
MLPLGILQPSARGERLIMDGEMSPTHESAAFRLKSGERIEYAKSGQVDALDTLAFQSTADYDVIVVSAGEGEVDQAGAVTLLTPGSTFFARPGAGLAVKASGAAPLTITIFGITTVEEDASSEGR